MLNYFLTPIGIAAWLNESRRFTLRKFRFLATKTILREPRWAVGFAKGKSNGPPTEGAEFCLKRKAHRSAGRASEIWFPRLLILVAIIEFW